MRRNVVWAVFVVAAALIQTTWLDALRVQGVLPDLVLLLVVYFAIEDGEERAMFTGVLGGLYQDVVGNAVLGHHVLCHVVVAYMTGRVARRLITQHAAVKVGLVFFASLTHGFLFVCIQYVQTPEMSAVHTFLVSVVPGAFYTALATPLLFFILGRAFRRKEEPIQKGVS